jgi:DNA-binding transcriptional MerR regulator
MPMRMAHLLQQTLYKLWTTVPLQQEFVQILSNICPGCYLLEVAMRIGVLSARTGVSEDLLRAWERRYGLLRPERTAGGFRLYSEDDLHRVTTMTALLRDGMSAAQAAETVVGGRGPVPALAPQRAPLTAAREALRAAVRSFEESAMETAIDQLVATVDIDVAIREVLLPTLVEIGTAWAAGELTVAQEHLAVGVLRARLMALGRGWDAGFGPRALLACPEGELHDVSLVMFGLALRRRGWRVTFLGANTPIADLEQARKAIAPDLTVLFAVDWNAHAGQVKSLTGSGIVLAGSSAGAIARETGCRWLEGDPVTAAETVTREAAAARKRGRAAPQGQ